MGSVDNKVNNQYTKTTLHHKINVKNLK